MLRRELAHHVGPFACRRDPDRAAALAIGGSIGLSLVTACLFGLSIPSLLHSLKLDPKIAAGPVTLAITDFVALTFYFGIASLFLRRF